MRLFLVGNFGVGNLGDELLRRYFVERFPEIEWIVMVGGDPKGEREVTRFPFGLRSVFRGGWRRTWRVLRGVDGVVFGGGSLLTDSESVHGALLWWWQGAIVSLAKKPLFLAFQGIGPFRTPLGEWCARQIVASASFISVRDAESAERIRSWNLNAEVIQTFDPAFGLMMKAAELFRAPSQGRTQKVFIIIPRANSSEEFLRAARETACHENYASIRIVSLAPENHSEKLLCDRLQREIPRAVIRSVRTLEQLMAAIQDGVAVLSQRYHGALAALALGIPARVFPQESDDKFVSVASLLTASTDESRRGCLAAIERGETALRARLLEKNVLQ